MSSHPRTASLKLRFVIVGGSLGGLAAALALARAGHAVLVLEKSSSLVKVRSSLQLRSREGGCPTHNVVRLIQEAAGILVPPNLTRILMRWGFGPQLARNATRCKRMVFRSSELSDARGCTIAMVYHDDCVQ